MIQDSDNELGDHKASEAKTSASKSTTTPINQHGLIENKTPNKDDSSISIKHIPKLFVHMPTTNKLNRADQELASS
ncbi:unnamed protein product [Rhizophagus irregularis]|nr:unnamed protein product [Rhizophagus irregularis]